MIPCEQCEYQKTCWPVLKLANRFLNFCQQGRKKKQFREKQTTLGDPIQI